MLLALHACLACLLGLLALHHCLLAAHSRNGIDFFVFSKEIQWQVNISPHAASMQPPCMPCPAYCRLLMLCRGQLPAYLVGRIEWDQWLLLRAMCMPDLYTIEVC